MRISAFIFGHTLSQMCADNKSELARRLGVTFKDVYQYERQFDGGGGSAVGMDALLEMYLREKISLDAVMNLYEREDTKGKIRKCPHIQALVKSRDEFAQGLSQDDTGLKYLKSADTFIAMQERLFCGTSRKPGACRVYDDWDNLGQPDDMD